MSTRLDHRITRPDRLVQLLAVLAAALYVTGAAWLVSAEVGDAGVGHLPAVHVDNQSHLTLQVDLVDRHGGRLALGAYQPGPGTCLEVIDVGPSWTFESFYGGQRVDRQTLDRAALARQGWTVQVPAAATGAMERAGYR
jgi:hypothetical protein